MAANVVKVDPRVSKFFASIEKRTQIRDVFVKPNDSIECVNSGSSVINLLIGGTRLKNGKFVCPGWPKGKIVEIFGRESSGKSTVAMHAVAHVVASGGVGLYVDLECAVTDYYSKALGVDFNRDDRRAIRAMPHSFEEAETLVNTACLQGFDIIVIDSVAALVSNREAKRDTSDEDQKQGIAEIPRLMSAWMPKLQRIIATTNTCVIFLNQTRDKIGAKGFTEEALKSTTGGNALKFYASVRALLKPKMSTKAKRYNPLTKENEDVQISTDVEIKMVKNKVDAKQGHTGLFAIRYGVGIDEVQTMLNVAEAYGVLKKAKNKQRQDVYTFRSDVTGRTIEVANLEKFRLALSKDPETLEDLMSQAREQILLGTRVLTDEQLASLSDGAVQKRMDDDDDYTATDAPGVTFIDPSDGLSEDSTIGTGDDDASTIDPVPMGDIG